MQHLDEGFFDTGASEVAMDEATDTKLDTLTTEVLSLPLEQRLQFIRDICTSFPTAALFELHNAIASMVYFDPVRYLPNELILQVFSNLSPKDLLTASLVSRPWRERTQDERIWHDCFGREGWVLDKSKLGPHEEVAKRKGVQNAERLMRGSRPILSLERRSSRKRPRDEAFNSENESTAVDADGEQSEDVEAETSDSANSMEGVEGEATASEGTRAAGRTVQASFMSAKDALMDFNSEPTSPASDLKSEVPVLEPSVIKFKPTLFSDNKDPRISWPYLYKQRRRLERNWETGKYTMFRLPDPNHEEEGHQECVYTIQHNGSHLVSGSRDKTIRIWELNTYRLKTPPLRGHEASVLCLQFDDRPGDEHDIIISGGSDNLVIVWRFSTGELIKKLEQAHNESVLNLRFDDRYLVTCSKDKTIKIWNRHGLFADDPAIPSRVVNVFKNEFDRNLIPAFTHLDTLTGHAAAVNAVQINGDTIVSASGDRTIKSWNIHKGTYEKSYSGHLKGIACVQFDGRRIVSGSSDESVRIFDYETQAEVAYLEGHNNLVRTVQARFGDLQTKSDEELLEESREADRNFLKALDQGLQPAVTPHRRRGRNAGSSRPEDMLSYGTKIPPGGGGSKWAKIVSGSYDETVIIWKRGKDGKWHPNQRLHQGMLLNHPTSGRVRANALPQPANLNNINAQTLANPSQQAQQLLQRAQNQLNQVNTILQQPPIGNTQVLPTAQITASSLNVQMQALASQQHQLALNHGAATTQQAPPATAATNNLTAVNNANNANNANPQQPAGPDANGQPQAAAANNHHHHHHAHHHHHGQANGNTRESNRVFKLQFDARRIIACSQNKVIVGWDFAAGDKDLEWVGDWSVETP